MARKKSLISNWQENYAGLILGAIIVIILGLLVANFITNRGKIGEGEQTEIGEETAKSTQYTVKEGDSLSKISEQNYGEQDAWPVLARINNIVNPNIIFVGSTLEIPSAQTLAEIKMQMTQTSYDVLEGDTLFIVAEKMYGDGSKWPVIAKANNVGRLPNGNPLIFAGSTLTIPR
ncbi:hypothetical protein A3J17_00620 [Candidatus Curtissbacteria bacterium RIFCSPLOWO2_02_FULL_40_11]|uniref:LysM domain-containing protein n=1 Tax=Candidatus Curtissbacteria bacterium RIFCSPHIGHO2_02_FULL_40_16b TaxID=1797714 RepID=A0A1F5G835_9BACT|nr:MAG: hypothetical protein A3D04_03110 [Candidatus Curtissbacteria bacterium RIFCSPHIGHO2_02_FULL_40_16b]OGE01560.1 MAG: hypothetical protein A3J17_00620 [Candidatus Curtissbacteria bacterium RIFCSPLOWO2_02_FULL_40_11]